MKYFHIFAIIFNNMALNVNAALWKFSESNKLPHNCTNLNHKKKEKLYLINSTIQAFSEMCFLPLRFRILLSFKTVYFVLNIFVFINHYLHHFVYIILRRFSIISISFNLFIKLCFTNILQYVCMYVWLNYTYNLVAAALHAAAVAATLLH